MTTRKKRRVKTKPPADFFREKVKRVDNTAEVRMLRLDLCLAADALAGYYERHGLKAHISWNRTTAPPDADVIVVHDWASARRGNSGNGGEAA